MNPAYYVIIFMLIFFLITQENKRKTAVTRRLIKKKRLKGAKKMHELLEKYIGQECIIYTINSQITGTVSKMQDGWLSLTDNTGNEEALNLDYIIRVREVPRKKNGKKKSVVLD